MPTTVLSRLSEAILHDGPTGLAALMTDDAVLELPLVSPPVRLVGRAAITAFLQQVAHAPRLDFNEHRLVAMHAGADADEYVAEFELRGTARASGEPFCLPSIAVIRERHGQIALYRDYFNPALVMRAAGAQPRLIVERLRRAIADKDMDAFAGLFAADGVLEYVFAAPGLPARLEGRAAIRNFLASSLAPAKIDIREVRAVVHETLDPDVVVAEIEHTGVTVATQKLYRLAAIGVMRLRHGEIAHYRDYMDTLSTARALGALPRLVDMLAAPTA
jgi:ketosteroid isomerase-like protein